MLRAILAAFLLTAAITNAASNVRILFQHGKLAAILNPGEQVVITAVLQAPQSGTATQGRYVAPANVPDIGLAEVLAYQSVVTTAHPKHRAAP